jgi:hypothetical protein
VRATFEGAMQADGPYTRIGIIVVSVGATKIGCRIEQNALSHGQSLVRISALFEAELDESHPMRNGALTLLYSL